MYLFFRPGLIIWKRGHMVRGYRSRDVRIDYGELSRQSDLSIAGRAVHGIWTAALCFLIVVLSSTYFPRSSQGRTVPQLD